MQSREAVAFGEYLFDVKSYWMSEIFPALREEYRQRSQAQDVTAPEQVADLIESTPLYQYFAWLERHVQKEKYSGRHGLLPAFEARRAELEARLARAGETGLLSLDPAVAIPDYYAAVDTHQHPGNLTGDPLAGLVYKASAASTQPGQTRDYALHERFAALVADMRPFERVLDAGCGFGKSALTLAQRLPAAAVEGIDLAAPCLTLAAIEAAELQLRNLRYRQADVCAMPLESGTFDLVTSTMLLHELDQAAVNDFFRESFRVLEPGGMAVHLDFRTDDPFLKFLHHQHGRRNNEPYMEAFDRLNVEGALVDAGFEAPQVAFFAEADNVRSPQHDTWRFPWTVITARKPH